MHGDLKERLGIKHRRDIKKSAKSDIEQAPMFHRPHFRSESEISSFQPENDHGSPPGPRSPTTDSLQSSPNIGSSPIVVPPDEDMITPTARQHMTPSPWRGSYYSASNIPVPSPTPGPYDPPMSSVSQQPLTYAQTSSSTLQIPALRNRPVQSQPPEAYEMRVREPPDDATTPTAHRIEGQTESSYATAYDGFVNEDLHDPHDHLAPGHSQEESWRNSTYSTSSGPTVL